MAQVVMTLLKNRSREGLEEDVPTREPSFFDGDDNKHHRISARELREHWSQIYIRCDILAQRLKLEEDMSRMVLKLPLFFFCMVCFLTAAVELSPAESLFITHKHIRDHFDLGRASEVKTYSQLYDYALDFQIRNERLHAASPIYWCEKRYMTWVWNDDLIAPQAICKSPRLAALHMPGHTVKWSELHSTSGSNVSDTSAHGRLLGRRGRRGATSGGEPPPCEDKDAQLKLEEADANVTCENSAQHVCDIELGILLCPKTCGFCSPFVYEHTHKYTKPQVTLLPAIIFQTRFMEVPCHDFADTYNTQPYNPALNLLPALDGDRRGSLISCLDRTRHHNDAFAMEKVCPPGSPTTHCSDGKLHVTPKHTFHGMTMYPEVLLEPERDIARMRAVEWLDHLTEEVTMSTMVYTEDLEMFTSLSVVFKIDEGGNINPHVDIISYRDLLGYHKVLFIVCLIASSVGGAVGVLQSLHHMRHHFDQWFIDKFIWFEFVARIVVMCYPCILLIAWCFQEEMSKEFDTLLHTFLDAESLDKGSIDVILQHYLDVNTHIYNETNWLKSHKMICFVMFYIQVMQLLFYFNAHPRMATLTKTVMKAADSITHFMMLFGSLFCMLAFIAHWMLGAHIDGLGTYGSALSTQGRMIFGEFIYADGANELSGKDLVMYWLYAFTFMIVFFFTLLNFFLAIVVDAFNDIKREVDLLVVERSFVVDLVEVPRTWSLNLRYQWPCPKKMMSHFESICIATHEKRLQKELKRNGLVHSLIATVEAERRQDDYAGRSAVCAATDVVEAFPAALTQKTLSTYLAHYYCVCPQILCSAGPTHSTMPSESLPSAASTPRDKDWYVDCEAQEEADWEAGSDVCKPQPLKFDASALAASINSRHWSAV
eukprot:TRINITY_DN11245_c0_g1_i3.p1 TRINITY_DN11245_c0_g1~~TRINITY_DN11245_c0_g1_i3.p1  ORF type:complete len:882 (+),score=150.35 TRINITY_DN11245_c0_g1_i3:109-2754(+)